MDEIDTIPQDHGPKMRMWLERFGLVAQHPYIRSSDFELASRQDEFLFYLRRRLKLTNPLSYSEALSRGSWFHAHAQTLSDAPTISLPDQLKTRLEELKTACDSLGIIGQKKVEILQREEKDYQVAQVWWQAIMSCTEPNAKAFLESFRCLGTEVGVRTIYRLGQAPIILAGIFDRLMLNEGDDSLWIADYKTTDEAPTIRLATAPVEFQSIQYLTILALLLEEDWFLELYDLRPDTKVGGIIHVAFQKPSIDFCSKDRDFNLIKGPRGAIKKEYVGEPKLSNFTVRVRDWIMGEGEYLHLQPDIQREPRVNWSIIDAGLLLDDNRLKRYARDLEWLSSLANRPAYPANFRQASHHLREYGKVSSWLPFYLNHPREWPDLIRRMGLQIGENDARRDFIGPDLDTIIRNKRKSRGAKIAVSSLPEILGSHREEGE